MCIRDRYICEPCGYEYDPEVGDPDGGIAPGTAFEDIQMCIRDRHRTEKAEPEQVEEEPKGPPEIIFATPFSMQESFPAEPSPPFHRKELPLDVYKRQVILGRQERKKADKY